MAEQTYKERSPTAPQVASVWIQGVANGSEPHRHRTIPHGSVELQCVIGGRPRIVGPQTVPRLETLAPGTTVVGVRFRLGAAHAVLGIPASELVDVTLAAEAGYADQSHLTRECLRLAGLSPRALMQESLENCRKAGHDHAVSYAPLLDGLS